MEIIFTKNQGDNNIRILEKYDDHGYTQWIPGDLEGNRIYYKGTNESDKIRIGFWDKEDENMGVDQNQHYMVLFTEQRGVINMIPVNSEQHMEELISKLSIYQ